jgi:hypothetical protein
MLILGMSQSGDVVYGADNYNVQGHDEKMMDGMR